MINTYKEVYGASIFMTFLQELEFSPNEESKRLPIWLKTELSINTPFP